MTTMKRLLQEVSMINQKYDAVYQATGRGFNIFEITNMSEKEVHICQVIRELIDPKGSHFQGDVYLRLFVKHVLHMEDVFGECDYARTVVTAEHVINEQRRIDILLRVGNKCVIPIEAKIYAGDQDKQCFDYFRYAKRTGAENPVLYYLTCDGHAPSEASTNGMTAEEIESIRRISFEKEIIPWLEECMKVSATVRIAPVREIILQLLDVLRKVTGTMEDEKVTEIQKLIDSKDKFKSANQIAETVSEIKRDLTTRIFKALDERIKETYGLERLMDTYDFERVKRKSRSYQGICYDLGKLEGKSYSLGLRVAIGTYFYTEICLLQKGEIYWEDVSKIVKQEDIFSKTFDTAASSVAWMYLIESEEERPNFYVPNDAYYSLIEPDSFDRFVDQAMRDLDSFVACLKGKYRIK